MSWKDVKGVWDGLPKQVITALIVIGTILGTHVVTESDLDGINTKVSQVQEDIKPLQERVSKVENQVEVIKVKDLPAIHQRDNELAEEQDRIRQEMQSRNKELEKLISDNKESFYQIRLNMEKVRGSQELTNEKLNQLQEMLKNN